MSLDAALLSILACPEDKGPLYYIESEQVLYNQRSGRTYEIRDDIPVMLVEESTIAGEAERSRMDQVIVAEAIRPTFEA